MVQWPWEVPDVIWYVSIFILLNMADVPNIICGILWNIQHPILDINIIWILALECAHRFLVGKLNIIFQNCDWILVLCNTLLVSFTKPFKVLCDEPLYVLRIILEMFLFEEPCRLFRSTASGDNSKKCVCLWRTMFVLWRTLRRLCGLKKVFKGFVQITKSVF
jgi:hypothetical protein